MRFIDEYRSEKLIRTLERKISKEAVGEYTFMEVCGGHTAAIHRFGIPSLLPPSVRLLSGPGCPVCVTPVTFIDKAVALASMERVTITSFGDLMRVPGTLSSLEKEKARGADVRMVFSALDALEMAKRDKKKRVVFMAIGFETTAPGTAAAIIEAAKSKVDNFFVLNAHKVMPPAMEAIIRGGTTVNGFICPGHVAAVTGADVFSFIPRNYRIGCVISGFEPVDIMLSVYMLVKQVNNRQNKTEIQYSRVVTTEGNLKARKIMNDVFVPADTEWRGIGIIKSGGLALADNYSAFDAERVFSISAGVAGDRENKL